MVQFSEKLVQGTRGPEFGCDLTLQLGETELVVSSCRLSHKNNCQFVPLRMVQFSRGSKNLAVFCDAPIGWNWTAPADRFPQILHLSEINSQAHHQRPLSTMSSSVEWCERIFVLPTITVTWVCQLPNQGKQKKKANLEQKEKANDAHYFWQWASNKLASLEDRLAWNYNQVTG